MSFFTMDGFTLLLTGILLLLCLACFLLAVLFKNVRSAMRRSFGPKEAEIILSQAEDRARTIVAEATVQAQELRVAIEKDRLRALSEDGHEIKLFIDAYRTRLDSTMKELSYGIEREHMRATSAFVERLQNIESRVAANADEARHSMDAFTNQSSALFEQLATEIENVQKGIQHLAVALEEAAVNEADKNADIVRREMQKIGTDTASSIAEVAKELNGVLHQSVAGEFSHIANELAQYRSARMRLVDERIITLIEETVEIVLQKKMSMQDHSDFVYRSLEEAKERGIFI